MPRELWNLVGKGICRKGRELATATAEAWIPGSGWRATLSGLAQRRLAAASSTKTLDGAAKVLSEPTAWSIGKERPHGEANFFVRKPDRGAQRISGKQEEGQTKSGHARLPVCLFLALGKVVWEKL